MIGAAADDARAEPLDTRAGSRSVRLALNLPRAIRRQEFAEIFARMSSYARAAMRRFVRPHQHLEIFLGIYVRSGFQQRAVQAAFGENLRGHAPAGSGADNANVILFWRTVTFRLR